ncbi:MAG: hypothetical protein J5695_07800 [Bacteroidales bacterium]|nr:hypothetical protein [Bacteroidales bacterium]
MKKIFAAIIIAAACISAGAQNNQGKMDDAGRIALTPVILPESSIPPAAANVVLNKLTQIVTKNGLAGSCFDPRFIITANMVELDHYVTATAPPMQAYSFSPTLYLGDAATGTLYATCPLGTIKGAGSNDTQAIMQAVKALRTNAPEIQAFIETGKTRIIEWYNTQIDFLISEANSLAGQDKYDEAIALLYTVPTVCKEAFDKAMRAAEQIFQQMIDIQGAQLLNTATHVWNANQSWAGANEAAGYLSQIHPLSSAMPGAMSLSETIAKRVKELDNREWNFAMKQFDASVSLESQRISAMAEVGKAMAKRPVNYYNMNSFGWW